MTKEEIIKKLRDMAKYPTVTLPRDCEALKAAADVLAQPEQEPVAWLTKHKHSGEFDFDDPNSEETVSWSASFPVYTTPPLRSNYE